MDTSTPPTSPTPVPIPPDLDGAGANPIQEEEDSFASLTPAAILGKSTAPDPGLSREELLAHAAKDPDTSLILPQPAPAPQPSAQQLAKPSFTASAAPLIDTELLQPPKPAETKPTPPVQPVPAVPGVVRPMAAPVVGGGEFNQVATAGAMVPAPRKPLPPPPAPPTKPAPVVAPVSVTAPLEDARPRRRVNVGLVSAIGAVLAVAVLAGTGYALALQGVRVPFVYQFVTGLHENGVRQAADGKEALLAQKSFAFSSESGTDFTLKGSANKPDLPTGDTSASGVAPVARLASTIRTGYALSDASLFAGELLVQADNGSGVPVLVRNGNQENWYLDFPLSAKRSISAVPAASVKKTLLYPVTAPLPVSGVLDAVASQSSYAKRTRGGVNVGVYGYTLNAQKLAGYFPEGATLSGMVAEVSYAWKTGLPTSVVVNGEVTFEGQTYTYRSSMGLTNFGAAPGASIADMVSATQAAGFITTADAIAQLGISAASLPGSVAAATSDAQLVPHVIAPSGQTKAEVTSSISAIPALPSTTVSAEAKARDAQRKKDLADLQTALEGYKKAAGSYPVASSIEQVQASNTLFSALVPTYLTAMPVDPLPSTFWYEYSSDGTTYRLRSVAEDTSDASAKKGAAFSYYELSK